MTVLKMISLLQEYWQSNGAALFSSYDIEKGAATANPKTFLRVLGNKKENIIYVEPCRRPQDGRYGTNPSRLYQHHQLQLLIKPAPNNIEQLYLKSLEHIGIDISKNDIKFLEDNWEQPTLGAWGLGSEVRLNGMEITQFTYFNQIGTIDLEVKPIEISYGIERLALAIQDKSDIMNLEWNENVSYKDIFYRREREFSEYIFEVADIEKYFSLFEIYISEAEKALDRNLALPAYDNILKASNAFNILDARKAITTSERQKFIHRSSKVAKKCCEIYLNKE